MVPALLRVSLSLHRAPSLLHSAHWVVRSSVSSIRVRRAILSITTAVLVDVTRGGKLPAPGRWQTGQAIGAATQHSSDKTKGYVLYARYE